MIKQKLIALLTIIGLFFMTGCGGIAIKRPAFANEESVVGQRIYEVMDRFGPPHASATCAVPIPTKMGEMKEVSGDAVFWSLEKPDVLLEVSLCVISDYVVAEKKIVAIFRGGVWVQTAREIIDYRTLADALEEKLQRDESGERDVIRRYLHKEDEFEI